MDTSIFPNRRDSEPGFLAVCFAKLRLLGAGLYKKTISKKPQCGGYNEAFVQERWAHYECPEDLLR